MQTTIPAQDWYFTFGCGQQHDGKYVVIHGTYDEARAEMVRRFGTAWCDQYRSAERAGVQQFGLRMLPREDWPAAVVPLVVGQPTLVAAALGSLSPFNITTVEEAAELLPMWRHYPEMSADDVAAVLGHYREGGAR